MALSPPERDLSTASAPPWHALPVEEVLRRLETGPEGLPKAEAARRLSQHGPNLLHVAAPISAWKILVAQLKSLVVALLCAAAVVSFVLGDWFEAGAIFVVLLLNTALGFGTEWRARRAMESLRNLQVQKAVVLRGGKLEAVEASQVVPGDLLSLEAGSAVPADARLVTANELSTIEAPLTGEALPVAKTTDPVAAPAEGVLPLGDRRSMVYKGTLVATGTGLAAVTGTGLETEIGRISELLQEVEEDRNPLEERLDRLGRRLVVLVLALAGGVIGLGVLRGLDLWQMVETGIALAVAAVPEGLPIVATIALSVGMRRMIARHALLRHLPSVETLGSATVICTDKTGTLTAGEMTATTLHVAGQEVEVTGSGYGGAGELRRQGQRVSPDEAPGLALALRIAVLTNHAEIETRDGKAAAVGDPMEAALLVLGSKGGMERSGLLQSYPQIAEVPFSSERMLMATFHESPEGSRVAYVKGAPGKLLERSSRASEGEGSVPLDEARKEDLLELNRSLAGRGLRVLALAVRELEAAEEPGEASLEDLTFVGFAAFTDPPAPQVRETVDQLRRAGIRTVMITGDQVLTAKAIGEQLGVLSAGQETLDGRLIPTLSDAELADRVQDVATFARVSPEDKLRIVRAFQERGDIVGMLGDGVNDAPALKQADIGVAMGGRGTDVAKETAEMVLVDDRFESIAAAVEEGRVVFDNIRKFVFYLFSCNLSEALVVVTSVLFGLPIPLLPLQILWLNLVTDVFPALALALEPAEDGIMDRPPRDPKSAILSINFGIRIGAYGVLITVATLASFLWALGSGEGHLPRAMTVAFMTLALAQLFHVFSARSFELPIWSRALQRNPWIWRAFALTVGLQLAAVYFPPLRSVLGTIPLSLGDWAVIAAASILPLVLGQVVKAAGSRLQRR